MTTITLEHVSKRFGSDQLSGDPAIIAAGLARVIADPQLARRLAVSGHRHVNEKFSMPQMAAAYKKLFESLWSRRS